jgi:hypothetical protein
LDAAWTSQARKPTRRGGLEPKAARAAITHAPLQHASAMLSAARWRFRLNTSTLNTASAGTPCSRRVCCGA